MNILVFCDVQLIHVFYKCSAVTRTRYTFAQSLWPCLFRVCVAGRPVCVGVCVFRDVCVCVCVCGPRRSGIVFFGAMLTHVCSQ